jgi:hypothetical protein
MSLSEMWCVANTWICKSIGEPQIERTKSDPLHISGKVMMVLKLCQNLKSRNEAAMLTSY